MNDSSEKQHTQTSNDTNLTYWIERWQANKIGFHRTDVDKLFKLHLLSKLISSEKQQCVLFPLCGKTLDMKAVLDTGHRVIGIEGSQDAVEAFFKENNISYKTEKDESNQYQVYTGIDCPVTIYFGNFFAFNSSLPTVDYIWDRGGLVAITPSFREQYRDCLFRMMTHDHTQVFLVAINYNDLNDNGRPPHKVTDDDIKRLFGTECSTNLLDINDETEEYNARRNTNKIDFIEERLHLIVRKKN